MKGKKQKPREYKFSIIIPVLHEGDTINSLLETLHNLESDEYYEIIVVDGSPEKDTIRVIKNKDVISLGAAQGRARQMNAGASIAHGEILVFLHADTQLQRDALNKIREVMEQKQYVGGAFDLCIRSDRLVFKMIGAMISLRSRLTRIPYGDQVIFIRRGYFKKIGGYRDIPLMEDVELMHRIKKSKDKIHIISDYVIASPRRWEKEGIVFCTVRNWFIRLLYYFGVSPNRLIKLYRYDYDDRKELKS